MRFLKKLTKILLAITLMFTGIITANASVSLSGLSVNSQYLVSGRLNVTNSAAPTKFKFSITLYRNSNSLGQFNDGTATATLVHRYNAAYEGNEINLSTPISFTSANFDRAYATKSEIEGELPAGIQSGSLLIKLTFFDTEQGQMRTVFFPQSVVNIQYTPPARVPVYEWLDSSTGDISLGMTIPVPSSRWNSRGIFFYAHNVQVPGSVPIYEFQGNMYNAEGQPGFPQHVTYYSTSTQQPITLPGLGSGWIGTPKVLFYAFPTQVAGTLPVKCYSNAERNNFIFMATGEIADSYSPIQTVFYAYPVVN